MLQNQRSTTEVAEDTEERANAKSLSGRARDLDLGRRRHPPRVDHQPQRQPLRLRALRRRDAVDRAEDAALLQRARDHIRVADIAFELELHQPIERDGHRRLTLHVDTVVADITRQHCGEPRRTPLVLPCESGGKGDGAALGAPLGRVRPIGRRIVGAAVLQGTPPRMWRC